MKKNKNISLEKAMSILKKPITTEKSTILQQFNQYSFVVSKKSNSFEIKTQLRFQEKIVLEHIANIEKLKEDNKDARRRNYRKQYGNDFVF